MELGKPRRYDNIGEISYQGMEIYKRNSELNINRQEIPVGSVVYFIEKYGHKWSINFGTIEEHYTSEICVQLYELADTRYINGVPINDFETPTKWKKLPKGWTYDTELFELTYGEHPDEIKTLKINNIEDILAAIKTGILVKVQDIDHCTIDAEIDSKKGWRIIRKYSGHYPTYKSFTPCEIFRTYDEAQKMIDLHNAEFERQANLTDLEWSIEQIDKDINRWAYM